MIISASFAVKMVSKVSKNMFSYVLLSFTMFIGIAYVGKALSEAFRHEVVIPDRPHYFTNYYASETLNYLQLILALQGWIFARCYTKSATASLI